jgi:hypothetical protein
LFTASSRPTSVFAAALGSIPVKNIEAISKPFKLEDVVRIRPKSAGNKLSEPPGVIYEK